MEHSNHKSHLSTSKFFRTKGDIILAVSQAFFETISVISSLPTYSSDESLAQSFELCNVIDFTKIADALHLITHYGAVSAKRLDNASDEKEAGRLLMRKLQSDAYLSKHDLDYFDDRLDDAYPEPIGLKDKSKWYSVASRFLTNAFKTAKVQVNRLSSKIYFTNSEGERSYIDGFSKSSFVNFLEIVLHTSKIFDYQLDWTNDLLVKYVTFMIEDDLFSIDSIANDIIQFNDCYVENGEFHAGKYQYIPRFYIHQNVQEIVDNKRCIDRVEEIDDFLLHLVDYDPDSVPVFLSRMSTFLLNSEKLKSNFSATINVLYGASGQNGKSLFLSIFKKIFDNEDIIHAGLRDFNNRNYLLPEMCQSLLIVDEDAADLQLDSAATSAIKQFTHGQPMKVRSIYEKTKTRLEIGDKIFFIDEDNRIEEIVLKYDHLAENHEDRRTLDGTYQLKSDIVESGQYIWLTKVTYREEIEYDGLFQSVKRRREYEDTDKVAYLSFDEAQSHLNDLISQQNLLAKFQSDADRELKPHLTAIKQSLLIYFDKVYQYDIEESLLKSEDHQKLLRLRESIDF